MAQKDTQLLSIVKHFNTPEDVALSQNIKSWREEHIDNERYYQEIYRLWTASSEASALEHIDVNAAVARFAEKIGANAGPAKIVRLNPGRNLLQWAAGFAALLLVAFFAYRQYRTEPAKSITKATLSLRDSVTLSDGSKVYLDVYSSITYPEKFEKENRTISFEKGNAFFKITGDNNRPFTIEMDSTAVKVLGTSFNISKNKKVINVDVKTGKVMFLTNGDPQAILTAGNAASYDLEKDVITTFSNQNQNSDAWLTGELRFVDEPLAKVFDKLEEHYHVTIDLDSNLSHLGKLNATFQNNDLDEVITVLQRTYPITIVKKGSKLTIKSK